MKLKLWPITGAGYLYAGTSEFVRQISKYMRWCKNNNSNPVLDLYPEGYNLHVGGAYKSIVHIADAVGFKESEITLVTGDMAAVYGCNVIKHEPFFMDKASDYCLMHPTEFLKNTSKHFGHFIGRATWDRAVLHSHIKQYYEDQSFATFYNIANTHNTIGDISNKLQTKGNFNIDEIQIILSDIFHAPYNNIDPAYRMKESPKFPDDTQPLQIFYEQIFVDIVHETDVSMDNFFVTEKTLRPIMFQKPFITMCGAHFMKNLQSLGFKTFDKWLDESYDSFTGIERLRKIQSSMEKIGKLDKSQRKQMLIEMQSTIEHNYEHLVTKSYRKNYDSMKIQSWNVGDMDWFDAS